MRFTLLLIVGIGLIWWSWIIGRRDGKRDGYLEGFDDGVDAARRYPETAP
jgi:hypothetical protein